MIATPLDNRAASWLPAGSRNFPTLRRLRQTRLVNFGLVILGLVVLCAIFAPVISPYDPLKQDYLAIAQAPSRAHWLGTDDLGRDVLSRIIYGSRVSLQVGAISVVIAVVFGAVLGLLSGYVGGVVDEVIMRFVDAVQAFPGLILALGLTAALGPSIRNVMIAIGFISSPTIARLARAQTLSIRES